MARAVYSKDPALMGAKLSPQGDVLAIINISEAGLGLRRGEVRGLSEEQAKRMFALKTALPYTEAADRHVQKMQQEEAKLAADEMETEDTSGPPPGFEGMKL